MIKAFLDYPPVTHISQNCSFTGNKSQTSALGHQIHVGESEEREDERKNTRGILSATWLHIVRSHLDQSQTRAQLAHPEPYAGRPGATLTFKYPLNYSANRHWQSSCV